MNSFWHFDAGNLSVLLVVAGIYARVAVMNYQHKMMWRDYEKRHGMNGKSVTESSRG